MLFTSDPFRGLQQPVVFEVSGQKRWIEMLLVFLLFTSNRSYAQPVLSRCFFLKDDTYFMCQVTSPTSAEHLLKIDVD